MRGVSNLYIPTPKSPLYFLRFIGWGCEESCRQIDSVGRSLGTSTCGHGSKCQHFWEGLCHLGHNANARNLESLWEQLKLKVLTSISPFVVEYIWIAYCCRILSVVILRKCSREWSFARRVRELLLSYSVIVFPIRLHGPLALFFSHIIILSTGQAIYELLRSTKSSIVVSFMSSNIYIHSRGACVSPKLTVRNIFQGLDLYSTSK